MLLVEDNLIDVVKNVFNLILKYFVDEISKGSVRWSLVIHEIHESDIDFAVVFQFSQGAVAAGHKSEKSSFSVETVISQPPVREQFTK